MSITRWDPFRDMLSLREAMNQLMEDSVLRPGAMSGGARGGMQGMAIDVSERDNVYQVTASIPGARPEDIEVTVLGDTLTIRAETKREEEREQGGYLLRERHSGAVQRSITLPAPIESDGVEARCENGELILILPKSRASMPRRIQVQASGGPASLEAQTPGLDEQQARQTRQDAQSFYERDVTEGDQTQQPEG